MVIRYNTASGMYALQRFDTLVFCSFQEKSYNTASGMYALQPGFT